MCLECAPKEQLEAIADMILQRSLRELDPSRGSVDELIITLPSCKHTFTVETLDGHCGIQDYYELDANRAWRGLKSPPPGFKMPPSCPTCRAAIRSPRYGRVYKRANLDIIEKNVASQLTKSMYAIVNDFKAIDPEKLRDNLKVASAICTFGVQDAAEIKRKSGEIFRSKILNSENEMPVRWLALELDKHSFGLESEVVRLWARETQKLRSIYARAMKISSTRSAHMKAWDSAFSSLYRQEIENAIQMPSTAPRYPAEHAMRVANMKVGLSKPLADKRFIVEAFWLTINIRILIANVAQELLTPKNVYPGRFSSFSSFKEIWVSFIRFVLETCRRDARVANRIAEASQSRKQLLHSDVLIFNIELEILKLNYKILQTAASTTADRDGLLREVKAQLETLNLSLTREEARHRGYNGSGMPDAEFERVFLIPMHSISAELSGIDEAILSGAVYQPVTYEEKQQIVAGLMSNYDLG